MAIVNRSIALALIALSRHNCSAFSTQSLSLSPSRHFTKSRHVYATRLPIALKEGVDDSNNDERIIDESSISPRSDSFPNFDAIKANVLDGTVGERGEIYVAAQFGLVLFIVLGGLIPYVEPLLCYAIGPACIAGGLLAVYRAAADLSDNLSPWPVPVDPSTGRGYLVNGGIYRVIRHPMYGGLLLAMLGLSLTTASVLRLALTMTLYALLEAKSEFEEENLLETYGENYEKYISEVPDKLFPSELSRLKDAL